jgi:hypothetical protein
LVDGLAIEVNVPLRARAARYALRPDDMYREGAHDLVERHSRVVERRPSLAALASCGPR